MIRACVLAVLTAGSWALGGDVQSAEVRRDPIRVTYDDFNFITTVTIQARDGRIAWGDVLRGVSRAQGYDDQALEGTLPDWSVRVGGRTANWLISATNSTFGPDVTVHVAPPQARGAQPQLVIVADRQAMLATQRARNKWLREKLLPKDYNGKKYGLVLIREPSPGPQPAAERQSDLVVFIHGLNSHPHTVRHLSEIASRNGLAAAAFHYPNDQPLDDSARLLSAELKRWKQDHPQQRISLVTHSMGALVARAAIEDPALDCDNVRRLIMVSPPNHGSNLAQFAFGLDIWEYLDKGNRETSETNLFYSTIEDGLSEATVDLEPDSIFLTRLNRRQRNPRVKYSIFLGTGGGCERADLENARGYIRAAAKRSQWAKFATSKIDAAIADLDEVVAGCGDGAVAVKRGRLAGVDDTVVAGFDHIGVLHRTENAEVKSVYDEVLKRLKAQP